jgi:hypothetical protein
MRLCRLFTPYFFTNSILQECSTQEVDLNHGVVQNVNLVTWEMLLPVVGCTGVDKLLI